MSLNDEFDRAARRRPIMAPRDKTAAKPKGSASVVPKTHEDRDSELRALARTQASRGVGADGVGMIDGMYNEMFADLNTKEASVEAGRAQRDRQRSDSVTASLGDRQARVIAALRAAKKRKESS